MPDLRDRFATLDRITAPDLWADAQRRAADGATTAIARPSITWRDRQPRAGFGPALVALLVVALAASLIVGAILASNWLNDNRTHLPATSTPAASPVVGPTPAVAPTATPAPTATQEPAAACAGMARPASMIETEIAASLTVQDVVVADCTVLIVSGFHGDGITELDPLTNQFGEHRLPGDRLSRPVINDGEVWLVANPGSGDAGAGSRLVRIDPNDGGLRTVFSLPDSFSSASVAVDGDKLYVGAASSGYVTIRDRQSGAEVGRIGRALAPIVVANGWLWGHDDSNGIVRFNLTTSAFETLWPSAATYSIGADSLFLTDWVVVDGAVPLVQLSLATGKEIRRISFPGAFKFGTDGNELWVLPITGDRGNARATEIIHLDQASGDVVERFGYPVDNPLGLWAAGNSLWIESNGSRFVRLQLP